MPAIKGDKNSHRRNSPWQRFAQPKLGLDTNIRIFLRYLKDFETFSRKIFLNRTAKSDMGIILSPLIPEIMSGFANLYYSYRSFK